MEMVALLLLLSCHVVLPLLTQRFGYLIWSDLMLDLLLLTLAASAEATPMSRPEKDKLSSLVLDSYTCTLWILHYLLASLEVLPSPGCILLHFHSSKVLLFQDAWPAHLQKKTLAPPSSSC